MAESLRAIRIGQAPAALGMAVYYLMSKPAFAALPFGGWSQVLAGQIHRNHYCFIIDAAERIHGFMGWAFTDEAKARAWAEGRIGLSYEESLAGDCIIFNAWAAESTRAHRLLLEEARKVFRDKTAIYFKRHYKSGETRAVRLSVNDAVVRHIARAAHSAATPNAHAESDHERSVAATHAPQATAAENTGMRGRQHG